MNRTSLSFRATRRTRSRSLDTSCPALRPGRVFTGHVPLGQAPFLHHLRRPPARRCSTASLVLRACLTSRDRASRDYRLSVPLAARSTAPATPRTHRTGHLSAPRATTGSPGSRAGDSRACLGSLDRAGSTNDSRKRRRASVAFRRWRTSAPRDFYEISRLNHPAHTPPINASPPPSRTADGRGRDGPSPPGFGPPPAQIPACGTTALGSCLGS